MEKRYLLVTGGAGFIGSNFISYILNNTDYYVTNVDALTYAGKLENTYTFNKSNKYRFIKCDISDLNSLSLAFENQQYDAIINFSAESHVDRSINNATPFIQTNINGTFNLLQFVLEGKANKIIQISTDEVYGSLDTNDPPFTEETPLAPNNPYSASKASADLLARSFYKTHQLPLIITRCSNNFGPMQDREKLIPKVIDNALKGKEIPIYGDGLNIRDWIYVEDHCRAILKVLENGTFGEVYNIGGTAEKTNLEVVKTILNYLGVGHHLITFVNDRKGHDRRYAMDSTKIFNELGWKATTSFEKGIEKTINWYQKSTQEKSEKS